jgi:Flp pilus assembly protein TadD
LRLGQRDKAEHAFVSALASNKYDSECHIGLGQIYEQRGEKAKALAEYKLGLAEQSNNPVALAGLTRLQSSQSN